MKSLKHMAIVSALLAEGAGFAAAQKTEAGILSGIAGYAGDIETATDGTLPAVDELRNPLNNVTVGTYIRHNLSSQVSFRVNFIYAKITASDEASADAARRNRNLHFRTDILEASVQTEISILKKTLLNKSRAGNGEDYSARLEEAVNYYTGTNEFRLYTFFGAGLFHFNPQASFNGTFHDLQPLGTEGQGIETDDLGQELFPKYKLTQACIPAGVGLTYSTAGGMKVGIEFGWRTLFTDYLDDISTVYPDFAMLAEMNGAVASSLSSRTPEITADETILANYTTGQKRGNPHVEDAYFFQTLTLSYPLGN